MKMKREDLFEQLDPPSGGLEKLRERMNARRRPSSLITRRRVVVPIAATLAIAAIVFFVLRSRRDATPDFVATARDRGGLDQVALGLASPPSGSPVLSNEQRATTALAEVPTSNEKVAFYWVSSTK